MRVEVTMLSPETDQYAGRGQGGLSIDAIAAAAREVEEMGFDVATVPEAGHDPYLPLAIIAEHTRNITLATNVAISFPRSPLVTAQLAWDLQQLSGGRFQLGLGTQVKGHNERRYAAPWPAPPGPRMREYILCLKAMFESFENPRKRSTFEGEHYQFTRMQPFFKPDPLPEPGLPIYLGGIGPAMTALAAEVSHGLMTHPTNCAPRYLREVVLPRLAKGAERAGRAPDSVDLMVGPLWATGSSEADVAREREEVRQLLAFLYSTPAYWPSLELFGWKERGEQLHALTRKGAWGEMNAVVDDAMLDTFALCAPYDGVADLARERYGELSSWITFPMPADPASDGEAAKAVAALRGG